MIAEARTAPTTTPEAEPVESYGERALSWWIEGRRPHGQRACGCLVCADGRALFRLDPLPTDLDRRVGR